MAPPPFNVAPPMGVFQHPSRSSQQALEYLREFTEAQDQLHVLAPILSEPQ